MIREQKVERSVATKASLRIPADKYLMYKQTLLNQRLFVYTRFNVIAPG